VATTAVSPDAGLSGAANQELKQRFSPNSRIATRWTEKSLYELAVRVSGGQHHAAGSSAACRIIAYSNRAHYGVRFSRSDPEATERIDPP